jgi:hypothetical protein
MESLPETCLEEWQRKRTAECGLAMPQYTVPRSFGRLNLKQGGPHVRPASWFFMIYMYGPMS